jgi:hypothetical protein
LPYTCPEASGQAAWQASRLSSAVEQRFCKPKVGSSILSAGTNAPSRRPHSWSIDYCPINCLILGQLRAALFHFGIEQFPALNQSVAL